MSLHNIGLALSGGGIRATIFHLGLFKWLADNDLLKKVKRISTVSGASLCVGMIYSHNNLKWPTSEEFIEKVLPDIEHTLLKKNLQMSALIRLLISPWYWSRKANVVARSLERCWGVYGDLQQLSNEVTWYINCTTYETGKRFRFCKGDMGDYKLGFAKNPRVPLSEVMAASAGFPIAIGPYGLNPQKYEWTASRFADSSWTAPKKIVHLWDGGVYDNLGLNSIFDSRSKEKLKDNLDFIIVSNACASIRTSVRRHGFSLRNLKRLLDISMDQVAALRTHEVVDYIKETRNGIYLKIGNSAKKIVKDSNCAHNLAQRLTKMCLTETDVFEAMNYKTTLWMPKQSDYQLLLRHGYEVAECTFLCYQDSDN